MRRLTSVASSTRASSAARTSTASTGGAASTAANRPRRSSRTSSARVTAYRRQHRQHTLEAVIRGRPGRTRLALRTVLGPGPIGVRQAGGGVEYTHIYAEAELGLDVPPEVRADIENRYGVPTLTTP